MARRQCLKATELQKIIDGWSNGEDNSKRVNVMYIPPQKVDNMSDEEFIHDDGMPTDQLSILVVPTMKLNRQHKKMQENVNYGKAKSRR